MLRPRGSPKIYRQNDIWHVRIYVPKSVTPLVGKSEIHRSLGTTDRREANELAVDERKKQFMWFNDLYERKSTRTKVVDTLSDAQIAEIARSVYVDYHGDVLDEYVESLTPSAKQQDRYSISASERDDVLKEMLDHFQPTDSAKEYADQELKRRYISIAPDNQSYGKLVRRVREAFIQAHVDFVNNLAGTPSKENNPYFIDPATQEPIQPINPNSLGSDAAYDLASAAKAFVREVESTRRLKGVGKIQNTMSLMLDHFGFDADIRSIRRTQVLEFRDQIRQLPSNVTKRYPNMRMAQAIAARKPQHATLSISSVNTHIRNVKQFMTTCSLNDENFNSPNLAKTIIDDPVDPIDKRNIFRIDQLERLFSSEEMRQSRAAKNTFYWCCLIGLYHGLRANEITGLSPDDFVEVDGNFFIDLKLPKEIAKGEKVGKSKTIPRMIPIHPILLRVGLFKLAMAAKGSEYLFPDLREDKDGYRSKEISDEMSTLISKIGLGGQKLSFHSFRHTFKDAADTAELSEQTTAYLGGWKMKGIMHTSYGSKEMKPKIIPAIAKISYGLIDHLD